MDAASALNPAHTAAERWFPIDAPPPAPFHRRPVHHFCRLMPSGRLPGPSASANSPAAKQRPSLPQPKPLRAYAPPAGYSPFGLPPTPPLQRRGNRHGIQTRCDRSAPPSASTGIVRRHSVGRWASRRLPDRLRLTGCCHGWFLVDRQELPFGLGRGERVAGNAVGLRTKLWISGIGEPALLAGMGVNPLLDVWQLLRPIHTGVAQVFVRVCCPAPGFVAVRHLCRKHSHGRNDMTRHQSSTDPNPASPMLRERCYTRCCQQRGQWIQEQNMTSANVHTTEDRGSKIDSARHNQVRQFSTLTEPLADERNTGQHHETDQAQSGLDGQRDWKVPPNAMRIVVPEQEDGILLRCIVDVSYPHQAGLRQQPPVGEMTYDPTVHSSEGCSVLAQRRVHYQPCRPGRIAKTVESPEHHYRQDHAGCHSAQQCP